MTSAQKHQDLFDYYASRQIEKLASRVAQLENSAQTDPEVLFFSTVLNDDGDNAFSVYERLFIESRGNLKNLAAEKLSQYYYARGFYIKSAEYEKYANTYIPVKTTEIVKSGDNTKESKTGQSSPPIYKIQVGAFGVIENANDLVGFLKGKNLEAAVVNRNVGGTILYCVWIDGDPDIKKTEKIAEDIKLKYQLSYRIVKP